jgi:hypothetical protein
MAVQSRCAEIGAALLAQTVEHLGNGTLAPAEQDHASATPAPAPDAGRAYARLDAWSCDHAWHFLSGMIEQYRDPLLDTSGLPVSYRRVDGFQRREPRHAPGSVVRDGAGWGAWTRDGVVHLAEA